MSFKNALNRAKKKIRKGRSFMDGPPSILEAAYSMDLLGVETAYEYDPECIREVTFYGLNALHIAVLGRAARTRHIMEYLLGETNIDVLHKDKLGRDPLDFALELGDEDAVELIEPYWHEAFNEAHPLDEKPDLKVVSPPDAPEP